MLFAFEELVIAIVGGFAVIGLQRLWNYRGQRAAIIRKRQLKVGQVLIEGPVDGLVCILAGRFAGLLLSIAVFIMSVVLDTFQLLETELPSKRDSLVNNVEMTILFVLVIASVALMLRGFEQTMWIINACRDARALKYLDDTAGSK